MDWRKDTGGLLQWVPPFRDLRIVGYLLLPEAFRSLSRLSSALSAKASTICSFYHDQNVSIALLTLASGSSLAGLVSFLLQKLYLGCLVFFFEILSCMRFSRYVLIIKGVIHSAPSTSKQSFSVTDILRISSRAHPDILAQASLARLPVRSRWLLFHYQMENTRFELVTSCLQGRRSPN